MIPLMLSVCIISNWLERLVLSTATRTPIFSNFNGFFFLYTGFLQSPAALENL